MELLFGVGAQPKQTDDVRHRPSQVLPKAMRVLPRKDKKQKRMLQRRNP